MITLMIASYRSFPQGGWFGVIVELLHRVRVADRLLSTAVAMVASILNIWHTRVNLMHTADTVDADAPDAGNMDIKTQITG